MGSIQSIPTPSIQTASQLIRHWHSDLKERFIFDSGRSEITKYLAAVDKILQSPAHHNEHEDLISIAVARLKVEFHAVLTRQAESVMGSTSITEMSSSIADTSSCQFPYEGYVYEALSKEASDYLRNIAKRMDSCGHLKALIEVYISVRKQFLDSIMKKLRLDEFQAGDIKRYSREELQMKVQRWIQEAKVCIRVLFPKEKQIAEQIFGGLGNNATAEESFMLTVKDAMVNVCRFAENVSSSHQSSERLEITLNLYNALSSLVPNVDALFQFESAKGIRSSVGAVVSGLQDEVRRMLSDFENAVLREASTIVDEGGAVHPLTKYVMEYLNLLVNHRELLMAVIVSKPSMTIDSLEFPDGELQEPGNLSPLALHVILIIAVLQQNLKVKGKSYKNSMFGYLFRMNNIQFIVQKIEGSKDLQELVGTNYLKELTKNLKEVMDNFQKLSCEKLLNCLKEDDSYAARCLCRRVSTNALKKQIKNFNSSCEDMHVVQSSWIIPDLSMREELCKSTIQMLLPAYESFLKKFRNHLKSGNNSKLSVLSFQKISVKYSVEDLKDLILKSYQLSPSEVPA